MVFNKNNHQQRSYWLFLFLVIFLVYLSARFLINIFSLKNYSAEINLQEAEIQELAQANVNLRELIDFLSSETSVSEDARTRLGMKQAGEEAVIITNQTASSTAWQSSSQEKGSATNRAKWFKYFVVN